MLRLYCKYSRGIYFKNIYQVSDLILVEIQHAKNVDFVFVNVNKIFITQYIFKQFVFLGREIHILLSDNRSEEKVRKYFSLIVWYSLCEFFKIFPMCS